MSLVVPEYPRRRTTGTDASRIPEICRYNNEMNFCRDVRTDMKLQSNDGKIFRVHKIVLMERSPRFKKIIMANTDWYKSYKGGEKPTIRIYESSAVVEKIVDFMYDDGTKVEDSIRSDFLKCARKLKLLTTSHQNHRDVVQYRRDTNLRPSHNEPSYHNLHANTGAMQIEDYRTTLAPIRTMQSRRDANQRPSHNNLHYPTQQRRLSPKSLKTLNRREDDEEETNNDVMSNGGLRRHRTVITENSRGENIHQASVTNPTGTVDTPTPMLAEEEEEENRQIFAPRRKRKGRPNIQKPKENVQSTERAEIGQSNQEANENVQYMESEIVPLTEEEEENNQIFGNSRKRKARSNIQEAIAIGDVTEVIIDTENTNEDLTDETLNGSDDEDDETSHIMTEEEMLDQDEMMTEDDFDELYLICQKPYSEPIAEESGLNSEHPLIIQGV